LDIRKVLVDVGANVNIRGSLGSSNYLIHSAVENRNLEWVNILLTRRDIDLNVRDRHGDTPLSLAEKKGYGEIVEVLRAAQRRP
jgi:ankyrin repeat protein